MMGLTGVLILISNFLRGLDVCPVQPLHHCDLILIPVLISPWNPSTVSFHRAGEMFGRP